MNKEFDFKALADRFLQWALPSTVCADLCATDNHYKFPRHGTNLLNAEEAETMLRHVLEGLSPQVVAKQKKDCDCPEGAICKSPDCKRLPDRTGPPAVDKLRHALAGWTPHMEAANIRLTDADLEPIKSKTLNVLGSLGKQEPQLTPPQEAALAVLEKIIELEPKINALNADAEDIFGPEFYPHHSAIADSLHPYVFDLLDKETDSIASYFLYQCGRNGNIRIGDRAWPIRSIADIRQFLLDQKVPNSD